MKDKIECGMSKDRMSKNRMWKTPCGGCHMVGREEMECLFNGNRVLTGEDEKVVEMESADGWTKMRMYLVLLNWTLEMQILCYVFYHDKK